MFVRIDPLPRAPLFTKPANCAMDPAVALKPPLGWHMRNKRGPTIGFRLTPEDHEALRKLATEQGRTMSNMASRFVSRCIAAARGVISNIKGLD